MSQEPLSDTDYELLDRFFAGETSAAENPTVHALLARWPEVDEQVQAIVRGVRGLIPDASPRQGIFKAQPQPTKVDRPAGRYGRPAWQHPGRSGWYALAGGLAVAVAIVAGWQLGTARVLGRLSASKTAYTMYVTTNGQRANITLPDGNMVALSVASRLEVPTNYSEGNHVLRLPVGEALFTVSHHAGAPFTVIIGAVTARVLGTSFMVRRYATDSVAMVAVAEGKVGVDNAVVSARHMVEVGRTGALHMHPVDASAFTFVSGVLPLSAMRLSDAIPELDRWYDADVRLGDPSLATQQIEGTVRAGSLADLTELLQWTCEVRVVRDGRVLTLYPKAK